jgi:hypothetical protein
MRSRDGSFLYREINILTQKEAAKKLGMKNIFSYQRLERGCNATLSIISKLMALFPQFSLDSILDGMPKNAA